MALDAILARKRVDLAARISDLGLDQLRASVTPSDRDFEAALRARRPAFILEVKPRSPSEGSLRAESDLGPVLTSYRARADAISVLTDRPFFGGSYQLLRRVRSETTQPILSKDFVIDPYQVYEARSHGADAVLLMLSVLDDATYRAAVIAATSLRMGVLTEVHSAGELDRALALGARVVGINNRNLRTLEVDLETTPALARRVPAGVVSIAESGIRDHGDVRRLRGLVDGFLVGTTIMKAAEPDRVLRRLIFGPTKVCGLTRGEDAAAALRSGASHGGVVFAPESPRAVSLDQARSLTADRALDWVGVFADQELGLVSDTAARLGLAAVQLHGDEPPEYLVRLRQALAAGTALWRADRVRDRLTTTLPPGADRVLLDAWAPDRRGGTGRPFDWSLLDGVVEPDRFILSGGLTPENEPRANRSPVAFHDVSSGVERSPGIKDPARLDAFFAARRSAPTRGT